MNKIPKIVHYIWFGNNEKSELIQKCQISNSLYLNGWDVNEWTESNYEINSCAYAIEAYSKKYYAFVSDYVRFDILYKYGGVYLDTDVELLKEIPEEFLNNEGFTGVESNDKIAPGLIFACKAKNPIVMEILKDYKNDRFILPDGELNKKTVCERVTDIFKKHGFVENGKIQDIEGIKVMSSEYFCAYDFITKEFDKTKNTVSIHHYSGTWVSKKQKLFNQFKMILKRVVGKKAFVKIVMLKRKFLGIRS